jgi:hypothetical protein
MRPVDVKVGQSVKPLTSAQVGKVGKVKEYAGGKRVLSVAVDFGDGVEWDFRPEELEQVEDNSTSLSDLVPVPTNKKGEERARKHSTYGMTTSISYDEATMRLAHGVDLLKEVNLFHMSSILAILFDKPKEKTFNDLLGYRGVRK